MMPTETHPIVQVLRESIEDLRKIKRETEAQDLLGFRLAQKVRTDVRRVLRREDLPDVEVDLLLNDEIAI